MRSDSRVRKKVLITGIYSRLGVRLRELAPRFGITPVGIDLFSKDKSSLCADVTKKSDMTKVVNEVKPFCVIHTAAFTDVDLSEIEKRKAWKINVLGSEIIADLCHKARIRLINISTDYVFDGKKGPYSESDAPHPLNYYGLTKWEAEKRIHSLCENSLTLRTCVPYDWNLNAPPNFLVWLIQKLESGTHLKIVTDQYNTPTYTPHLAEMILNCCHRSERGIIHVSGREYISRYDFAVRVCKIFKMRSSLIAPCSTRELHQTAVRPLKAGLKVKKAEQILKTLMLTVNQGLKKAWRDK